MQKLPGIYQQRCQPFERRHTQTHTRTTLRPYTMGESNERRSLSVASHRSLWNGAGQAGGGGAGSIRRRSCLLAAVLLFKTAGCLKVSSLHSDGE